MRSHEEAHSNDFHGHFPGVDDEKDEIDGLNVVGDNIDFFIKSEE